MSPFPVLLLFLAIPLVEIYFLIKVGGVIGAFSTVVLVVATAVLGASIARYQGVVTLQRVQATVARGGKVRLGRKLADTAQPKSWN